MEDEQLLQIIEQAAKDTAHSLDLSFKELNILPSAISKLTNLTKLNLKRNKLSTIPSEIGKLTNLTVLYLSYNEFTTFPPEIGNLTNLAELNFSNNHLSILPSDIGKLTNLVWLGLGMNKLTTLPPEIGYLANLIWFGLDSNQIVILPPEIGDLTNLEVLDLVENKLTELPQEIGKLTNLTRLALRDNQLTKIPPEIGNLKNLIELDLVENKLTELPQEIGRLSNLTSLDLGYNQLHTLPQEIGRLVNLTELFLSNNQLTALPDEICGLTKLTRLSVGNNHLTQFPKEISKLTNLTWLKLTGNPLPIPPEILALTNEPAKIITYYLQHQTEKDKKKPLNEAKMLLVGQGAVGKTSLVKRLLENRFDSNEPKTKGIDINRWQVAVNGIKIRLNVWDLGGQEIMHATHQFFLTERSLYVLVLDSRLDEQENRIEYWLKIIQSFGGNSPIIIVCNKSDEHELDLNWKRFQEKYPTIKAFAKRVSCKTGEGISELRSIIEQEVIQLERIHDELLTTWLTVKTKLEKMDNDYISYREYQQICEAENITDALSQSILLGLLHDLGIVLHFHDHPLLEDTNVLHPEWVTKGVYQIINSNELFQNKGVFEREDLDRILDPQAYPREKHMFIIDMMRKFELCFDFEGYTDKKFLVPELLPKEEPDTGEWNDSLAFQYHYDILPGNVISRFIVRMHVYISKRTYWRNGAVLVSEDDKNKALVKSDIEDKKVFIYIKGKEPTRRMFLEIIRADFRRIHATISQLKVTEKIPLPGHPEIVVDYNHLLTLEELGKETFVPEGLREEINVKQLLDGIESEIKRKKTRIGREYDVENSSQYHPTRSESTMTTKNKQNNPWISGSFYLFVFIIVMTAFALIGKFVSWQVLPGVFIAGLLAIPLIGVLQSLNDGTLSEKGFLKVVLESYKRLPLLRGNDSSKK